MTDESIMPFGMHKGKTLENVPAKYLIWMFDEGKLHGELRQYVIDNRDVLDHQAKEEQ